MSTVAEGTTLGVRQQIDGGIKAYTVTDDYEGECVIIFAERSVVARREGANELNAEFGEVTCRRAQWADEYAPGPVPVEAQINRGGFWFECSCGCGRRIDSDEGQAQDADENPMDPIYGGGGVYWNAGCKSADERRQREEQERDAHDQAYARAAVLARFPFATEIQGYRRTLSRTTVLYASFRFPGGKSWTNWEVGAATISIAQEDLAAWSEAVGMIASEVAHG